MSYKNILWQFPASLLRQFDAGEVISDSIPVAYGLTVGDELGCEFGPNVSGVAEVVDVGAEVFKMADPSFEDESCGLLEDEREMPMVDAICCKFKKLS
ncbi:MAG: hypothetical protein WC711_02335 [Candidatus Staskawiczbacteria bacterium]|jgi:hypothetical protein